MLRVLAYTAIVTAAIGAGVVSVPVAGVQLSLFRLSVLLMIAILFVDQLHARKYKVALEYNSTALPLTFAHKFMLAWLLLGSVSILWSADKSGWLRVMFFVMIGTIVTFVFRKTFPTARHLVTGFRLMALMALAHNIVGWYEVLTGNLLFLQEGREIYIERQFAASTFGNTNNFATYLVVNLSTFIIAAASFRNKSLKLLMYVGCLSSILLIFNSDSRANVIAVLAWVLALGILQARSRGRAAIAALLIAAAVSAIAFLDFTYLLSLFGLDETLTFNFNSASNSEGVRLNLILNGLLFLWESAGLGTGAGNIEYWMATKAQYPTMGIVNIHNWWMEILVSFGVVVFIGYLVMFAYLLVTFTRSIFAKSPPGGEGVSPALLAALVAFSIGSISASSNMIAEWLWVYFAVVINYASAVNIKPKANFSSTSVGFVRHT